MQNRAESDRQPDLQIGRRRFSRQVGKLRGMLNRSRNIDISDDLAGYIQDREDNAFLMGLELGLGAELGELMRENTHLPSGVRINLGADLEAVDGEYTKLRGMTTVAREAYYRQQIGKRRLAERQ